MALSPNTTISDARLWVDQGRKTKEGVTCPCCDQYVKLYKYSFNASMGASILWLAVECGKTNDGWVNVPRTAPAFLIRGRHFDKLKVWELATDKWNDDATKRCSGIWKATLKGFDFVNGIISVPKYAFLHNSNVEGFSQDVIDIKMSLKKYFNYQTMMQNKAP